MLYLRISLLFLLVPATVLFSNTVNVPADYPTIQGAIDAAVNGDMVLVAPGTYVENINFLGKAITVSSSAGPESTIIDGWHGLTSVVKFINGENQNSILNGFTICNGAGYHLTDTIYGGGICCIGSSPTISGNIIRDNSLTESVPFYICLGGGILCKDGSPTIINNIIHDNEVSEGHNGIAGGGGIYCKGAALIENNIICHNYTGYYNGMGGGIYCDGDTTILNSLICSNQSNANGGVSCNGSLKMVNSTVCNNKSSIFGGGITVYKGDQEIINTIVRNNTLDQITSMSLNLTVTYSNVQGGWPGTGNIDADPLFVDPAAGDFHLTYPSPCRDAGDNTVVTAFHDFELDPRIAWGGTVDIGADEFFNHLYVTGDTTPGGAIQGKFVGLPGTTPVGLFIGSNVLPFSMPTMWGEFWLQAPWVLLGPLGAIPSDGVMLLPTTLPGSIPAPYDVPMQALIGLNPDSLTNLFVLEVR